MISLKKVKLIPIHFFLVRWFTSSRVSLVFLLERSKSLISI